MRAIRLTRPYPSRYGAPVITAVDPEIFERTYFTHCMACDFCGDACCLDGVDVDAWHHERILARADDIERFTGIPRGRWFEPSFEADAEVPGGGSYRARVADGACVFLNRRGRGCLLHAYSLARGIDFRDVKSVVDCLFPLSFFDGVLTTADDVDDGSLVCLDQGPTAYRGIRGTLAYYFGDAFVTELDSVESDVLPSRL